MPCKSSALFILEGKLEHMCSQSHGELQESWAFCVWSCLILCRSSLFLFVYTWASLVVKRRLLSLPKVFNSFDPSNQHNRLLVVVTIATGLSKLHNGAQKEFAMQLMSMAWELENYCNEFDHKSGFCWITVSRACSDQQVSLLLHSLSFKWFLSLSSLL